MIFMAFPFPNESGSRIRTLQFGPVNAGKIEGDFAAPGYGGVTGSGYGCVTVPAAHQERYAIIAQAGDQQTGAAIKDINRGALGNSIAGAIGGGVAGQLIQVMLRALESRRLGQTNGSRPANEWSWVT
jgi:hypothetical protein